MSSINYSMNRPDNIRNGNNSIGLHDIPPYSNPQYRRPPSRGGTQAPPPPKQPARSPQFVCIVITVFVVLVLIILAAAGYAMYAAGVFDQTSDTGAQTQPRFPTPALVCPPNIVQNTALVSWRSPSSYNFPFRPVIKCSPPSETTFPNGETLTRCNASDNAGTVVECSFVIIIDNLAPAITCPPDQSRSSNIVTWVNPTASDNFDGIPTISCNPSSGSSFPSGVTTVTCTAIDNASNSATCSFSVTVDNEKPSISCPADITVAANPVTWPDPGATDNLDTSVILFCFPRSGSSFPNGQTLVACTANDSAGNEDTCTFTVTVDSEKEDPTITCPVDILSSSSRVTWLKPAVVDNIDTSLNIVCVPESGSVFQDGKSTVTCTVTDSQSNTESCSFAVTVDRQPPGITCPSVIRTSLQQVSWNDPAVTDNQNGASLIACTPPSGTAFPLERLSTVTCTVRDAAGNTAMCRFDVIVDQMAPPITCPPDITRSTNRVSWTTPTAFDAVDPNPTVLCVPPSGTVFAIGQTTMVTCTATDSSGFSNVCTFRVTIDQQKPQITCPANIISPSPQVSWPDLFVTDDVDQALALSCVPPSGYRQFREGDNIVQCTATDDARNIGSCTFTVTVDTDQEIPIVICPVSFSTNSNVVTWPQPVVSDNIDRTLTVICAPASGTPFQTGQTTVGCSATDNSGNTGVCSFTVYVDLEKPRITCPSSMTVPTSLVSWPNPTVSDNVNRPLDVSCNPPSGYRNFIEGQNSVTCTVSDVAGNSDFCRFIITVDITRPIITCPTPQTINTSPQGLITWPNPKASDNLDKSLFVVCNPFSGSTFTGAETVVTCSTADEAGNRATCAFTINSADLTPPTITCPSNMVITSTFAIWTNPRATDNVDTSPQVSCNPRSGSAFNSPVTTVTCTATDRTGNTGSCVFTVRKDQGGPVDNIPPTIRQCPTDMTIRATTATWINPTATDNIDNSPQVTCNPSSGSSFPLPVTTVTCAAVDAAGNTANCRFTVTRVETDSVAPTITSCPSDLTTTLTVASWANPTATDNVDSSLQISCSPPSGSTFTLSVTTVVCAAIDKAGNIATCRFTVTRVQTDQEAPRITFCPSDISSTSSVVTWPSPIATDNVDNAPQISCTPASGSVFTLPVTNVRCAAIDAAGNIATCGFTVTRVPATDQVAPTISSCPAAMTITSTQAMWTNPTATDNVDTSPQVSCNPRSGSTFPVGATPVTCTAMDATGNTAICSFMVTRFQMTDRVPPTIASCPASRTITSTQATWTNPTATDNVDTSPQVSCNPRSGSIFPVGATPVTCTAMDAAGNRATCGFTVTRVPATDQVAPTISSCPASRSITSTQATWTNPTATDNVDTSPQVSCNPRSGSIFPVGATPVTCTAMDAAGNRATCGFTVTRVPATDQIPPTIASCPASRTITSTTAIWTNPTATDNVDTSPQVSCNPRSGSTFPVGATPVTCTAMDAAGNRATCGFMVTRVQMTDQVPPTISSCPASRTIALTQATWTNPTATDNVDSSPQVFCNPQSGSTFISTVTTVTCTARDAAGNTATCRFTVTRDQVEPTISSCPAAMTITSATATWTNPTATDNVDTSPQVFCNPQSGSIFTSTVTTVTCTASDAAGNTATCRFTVTRVQTDQVAPVITNCPVDMTITSFVASWTNPTATDNVDAAPQVTCSPASRSTFTLPVTTVMCTATDTAGNTARCSFTVTKADKVPPTIIGCPTDMTITSTTASWTNPTATDNADAAPRVVCSPASGSTFTLTVTTVTCLAADVAGNSARCTFTVTRGQTDRVPPTITSCPPDKTITSTVTTWTNPTATDNVDRSPQVSCNPPSGSTFTLTVTTVTCTATDSAQNSAICSFTVTREQADQVPPTIIGCPTDMTTTSTTASWTNPTATDNVDAAPQVVCSPASGSTFTLPVTTVMCTATDAAGNTARCSFTVTRETVDQVGPTLTSCPNDMTITSTIAFWTNPTATDNVNAAVQVTCIPTSGSTFTLPVTTVTCRATDTAGNTAVCNFAVTRVDQVAPTIVSCPSDMTITSSQATWTNPTATDNLDTSPQVSCIPSSGSTFTLTVTTVTCTATDATGNRASCSFTVTMADRVAPTLTSCPTDMTITTTTASWTNPTATDNVDAAPQVVCSPASGSTFTLPVTTVTCRATDAAGNTALCTFTVTRAQGPGDQIAPTITSCPGNMVISSTQASWTNPTATDNVDAAPQVTCNPASGSTFNSGVTTVTCTATDTAGNAAICTFTVSKGGCGAIPNTATKCIQLLTGAHSDYDMTLLPNSFGDGNGAEALSRFNKLTFTTCNANAELFFCSLLFPDCPNKGWTRQPCRQLCQAVQRDCQAAYNAVFPTQQWAWDCNNFYNTGSNNELCLSPEGDFLNTGICGSQTVAPNVNLRIVNGKDADAGEWPFIGSFRDSLGGHRCGSSLLNEQWVVTAAHCIGNSRTVVFGDVNQKVQTQYHQERAFGAIITHPEYSSETYLNDVALIKLKEPVVFNDYIRPICLATLQEELTHYKDCWAVGWGRLTYAGDYPDHLQEASVPMWTHADCQNIWGADTVNSDNLCAGVAPDFNTGVGTCQGDSGGPMICRGSDDNRLHLVGITSFGPAGFCAQEKPNVVARVTQFKDWIQAQINGPNAINTVACSSNTFKCSSFSGDICILQSSRCDMTVYECPRHEDEMNCRDECKVTIPTQITPSTSFTINSGGNVVFKSPFFDDEFDPDYPSMMFCQWTFTAPADKVILVEFNSFAVEAGKDYVYVGTATGVGPLAREFSFSGSTTPSNWVSSGNIVTISMDTDKRNAQSYRGFQVTLTAVNPNDFRNPAYVDTNVCGSRPTLLPQISGSTPVTVGWPWMGSIRDANRVHRCGITLLDTQWAITFRTCVNDARYVVFGDHTTSNPSSVSTHVERTICGVYVHPKYFITLIKLCTPVTFNSQVAPACIHTASTEIQDYATLAGETSSRCRFIGWGSISSFGSEVSSLREGEVTLASDNCGYSDNYLCVKNTATSKVGPCEGDLGGPLMCRGTDNKWRIVGVPIRTECDFDDIEHPIIRLSSFQTFITESMATDADCANKGLTCNDGRCYSQTGRCNDIFECQGQEDELNC